MLRDKEFPVYGDNGFKATLLAPARFLDPTTQKRIRLEDGREIFVRGDALEAKADGSFYLRNAPAAAPTQASEAPTTPARDIEPNVEPPNEPVLKGSSVTEEPLFREDCDVSRVSVRRLIDKPVEPRMEGDTLIVPLMEEVLVLEKRLLLREELHIKRRREQNSSPATIRREELE